MDALYAEIESVTVELSVETTFPPWSSTVITGCFAKATPALSEVGFGLCVKTSFEAIPFDTEKEADVPVSIVVPSLAALKVYVPAVSTRQPEYVNTPAVPVPAHEEMLEEIGPVATEIVGAVARASVAFDVITSAVTTNVVRPGPPEAAAGWVVKTYLSVFRVAPAMFGATTVALATAINVPIDA